MTDDRKQTLQKLLAKVESGGWNSTYDEPEKESGLQGWALTIDKLMDEGSLDAAKALHEAVLPNVPACIHDMSQDYLGGRGWVVKVNWPHTVWQPTFTAAGPFAHEGRSDNPARAWLIAILKALIAQEDNE